MGSRQLRVAWIIFAGLNLAFAAGCTRSRETPDERLQRQAADDARQVRHDAENAGVEARKAARQAGRAARDIVAGVQQGWREGDSPDADHDRADRVDINTASAAELSALPGVSPAHAGKIIRGRPWSAPADLVRRHVLTEAQYDRIAGRVHVQARDGGKALD